ncbi:hypothetical protein BGY98DRAFT_1013896, partial [Russula aff. rugulosa BPL654]
EQPLAGLLRLFTSVKSLTCAGNCATYRPAFQELMGKGGWSVTRPANYFLGGPQPIGPLQDIGLFVSDVSLRHPVAISHW